MESESKILNAEREINRLTDTQERMDYQIQQLKILKEEQEVKLQQYLKDYERITDENSRVREQFQALRDQYNHLLKESTQKEIIQHKRLE